MNNYYDKAENKIKSLHNNFKQQNYSCTDVIQKEYNFEFVVSLNKKKYKILVYFGKKGVRTLIQGDEKSLEYNTIKKITHDEFELSFAIEDTKEPAEYIGSDECGKGDFFGPLVVSAVYVNSETSTELKKLGVRDSKDLSEYQIHDLSYHIKKVINNNFEIVRINPDKYNQLYDKFGNLNKLLNWAHSKAIDSLLERVNCKTVITDKFSNRDLDVRSNIKHSNIEFIQETGAEKFTAVAAASILARDNFNYWFKSSTQNNFNLPKGSSAIVENKAAEIIKNIGEKEFSRIAKLHFKTYNKISKKQ